MLDICGVEGFGGTTGGACMGVPLMEFVLFGGGGGRLPNTLSLAGETGALLEFFVGD